MENLLQGEVEVRVNELLKERDDLCECEQCRQDMIAATLTELEPRYAGSEEGRVVINSTDISSVQTRLDILKVVREVANKVKDHPHHCR